MKEILAAISIMAFTFVLSLVFYIALQDEIAERAILKFYDVYTGPIKEEKMGNKEKILSEANFLKKELEFVQERYISICEYIDGEKMYRAAGRQDILSNEEFCDCLLQKNAAEEYMAILKRRLDRAFKREGL